MGLFKNKYERDLDDKIQRIEMSMSNNYKDAAQMTLVELERSLEAYVAEGKLKEKSRLFYEDKLGYYKERMKGFTHKDQKPYWT